VKNVFLGADWWKARARAAGAPELRRGAVLDMAAVAIWGSREARRAGPCRIVIVMFVVRHCVPLSL